MRTTIVCVALAGLTTTACEPSSDERAGATATPVEAPGSPTPDDREGLVLFQALYGEDVDIGLTTVDGEGPERIPGGPGNRWHPMWSPDGRMISYDHELGSPDVDEIWVHDLSTGEDRAVTDCAPPCLGHQGASWTPDGRAIVFDGADDSTDAHPDGSCYLGLVDVATGVVENIAEWPGCLADRDDEEINGAGWPQYRPDGEMLVVQGVGPGGSAAVFTLDPATGETVQLTEWGAGARPVWSPDGSWIAFQTSEPESTPGGGIALHRIRPDGTGLEKLTTPDGTEVDLYPWWDESGIVFTRCPRPRAASCVALRLDPESGAETAFLPALGTGAVHVIPRPRADG